MRVLDGIRVLDATGSIAGQYCGKLLADQGADVALTGDEGIRARGALRSDGTSHLWFHLNLGKRAAKAEDAGKAEILLIGAGDPPDHRDHAIVCRFTDFGVTGARADWTGGEMILQALSGVMYQNGPGNRQPLYGCGDRASYAAGVAGYIAVLAALLDGGREQIEIETALMATAMSYNLPNQYFYNGTHSDRAAVPGTPEGVARCKDGALAYFVYSYNWAAACSAFGVPEMTDDPRYCKAETRAKVWSEVTALFERAVATQTVAELELRLVEAGLPVSRCMTPQDLIDSDHLDARGWWHETPAGDAVLGPPFRLSGTTWGTDQIRPRSRV